VLGRRDPAPDGVELKKHGARDDAGRRNRREVILMFRSIKIREYERGLLFRDREFRQVLGPGRHWIFDPFFGVRIQLASVRDVWLVSPDLDVIVRSGALADEVRVLDLKDYERALVWVDGRFEGVYGAGLRALWTVFHDVRVETVDARNGRFDHPDLAVILTSGKGARLLDAVQVEQEQVALLMVNGRQEEILRPGRHAFWRGVARIETRPVDMREQVLDVSGQELMSADKVTLRLNALVAFRVVDPVRALTTVECYSQALYRESQLALRSVIGARQLDAFLSDKERIAEELTRLIVDRAKVFGLAVVAFGIRDVILPGEMKVILNRVTEARKAAEADLITRREETAAIRSQANTARIFESNPALMRLRELEVLEKVADKAKLSVVLGEKGLADRIVKLL
jgi:regulator of protease activity HflC (stomatin/prohibitin superfamily)